MAQYTLAKVHFSASSAPKKALDGSTERILHVMFLTAFYYLIDKRIIFFVLSDILMIVIVNVSENKLGAVITDWNCGKKFYIDWQICKYLFLYISYFLKLHLFCKSDKGNANSLLEQN